MPAQVRGCIRRVEFPVVGILAQHVVGAPNLARPVCMVPGPAHGGHVFEPGQFRVEARQFLFVAELPRTAGAVQQIQLVAAIEASFFPVFGHLAHETDKRRHTGDGRNQQMVLPSAFRVERAFSLRHFPHQQFIARLQLVKLRRERPFRHQFEEKLQFIFIRSRDDRVRPLRPLAVVLRAQGRVLSRNKRELSSGLDAHHPQIGCELRPLGDPCPEKLLVHNRHCLESSRIPAQSERRLKAGSAGR